jgi:hypothetical protein
MQHPDAVFFDEITRDLIGLPLSHLWNGYGSALFLEFGALEPRKRRDGSPGQPWGERSVAVGFGWRIEGRKSIICGSWSEKDKWERGFSVLRGQVVTSVSLFGRLPEIDIGFSNGAHCLSFSTDERHPEWTVFTGRSRKRRWLHFKNGRFKIER